MVARDESRGFVGQFRPAVADKLVALALAVLVAAAVVVIWVVPAIQEAGYASSFCAAEGRGSTANGALASYLHRCGSNYTLAKGPYAADKSTTPYSRYAQVVEYTLNVANNSEDSQGFLEVGQRVAGGTWHTLGSPGTGP